MAQGSRPDRVADLIRSELSDLLTRAVKDPGVGFVTITRVTVSADLQSARVYYTCLADAAGRRSSARALDRAVPFLRRQIGHRLTLKRVPTLRFVFDESIEHQERIEQLLEELGLTDADQDIPAGNDDTEPK